MKSLTIVTILSLAAILSACDSGKPPQQGTSVSVPATEELKVIGWGPQSTTAGVNPNKQPGGAMGIWIEATGMQGLGEAQVLFGGQAATATYVQEKLITVAISPEQIAVPGKKEIAVKQVATGKLFSVGVFDIQPAVK